MPEEIDATRTRIDMKVQPITRTLIAVAAAHVGQTLTAFILDAAMEKARRVMRELDEIEKEEERQ